jgi:hypothetical protein
VVAVRVVQLVDIVKVLLSAEGEVRVDGVEGEDVRDTRVEIKVDVRDKELETASVMACGDIDDTGGV